MSQKMKMAWVLNQERGENAERTTGQCRGLANAEAKPRGRRASSACAKLRLRVGEGNAWEGVSVRRDGNFLHCRRLSRKRKGKLRSCKCQLHMKKGRISIALVLQRWRRGHMATEPNPREEKM